jgi:hypothetical protein
MMEAARTSETSVDIDLRRRQYFPEDSELHTRRRENLKSHKTEIRSCEKALQCVSFIKIFYVLFPSNTV